jgi:hypothetical protein
MKGPKYSLFSFFSTFVSLYLFFLSLLIASQAAAAGLASPAPYRTASPSPPRCLLASHPYLRAAHASPPGASAHAPAAASVAVRDHRRLLRDRCPSNSSACTAITLILRGVALKLTETVTKPTASKNTRRLTEAGIFIYGGDHFCPPRKINLRRWSS